MVGMSERGASDVQLEPPSAADADRGSGSAEASPVGGYDGLRTIEAPSPGLRRWLFEVARFRPSITYFLIAFMRKRTGRTLLGYLWLVLPVVLPIALGTLVFGGILNVQIENGVPYFLYFLIASGVWNAFSQTAYFATRSLEIVRNDLSKTYIPRLVPLMSAIALPLTEFCVFGVLGVITVGYFWVAKDHFYLDIRPATLLAPVALAMALSFGLACGLWFSPIAPLARDVRRTAAYVLSMWYFVTPVIYPIEKIPSDYRFLAELNPVTAPVELFKTALIGTGEVTTTGLASWAVAMMTVGGMGLWRFIRRERRDVAWYY
jgi:lipopolysaccharide transport system permease protein